MIQPNTYQLLVSLNKIWEFCQEHFGPEVEIRFNGENISISDWEKIKSKIYSDYKNSSGYDFSISYHNPTEESDKTNLNPISAFEISNNNTWSEKLIVSIDFEDEATKAQMDEISEDFKKTYICRTDFLYHKIQNSSVIFVLIFLFFLPLFYILSLTFINLISSDVLIVSVFPVLFTVLSGFFVNTALNTILYKRSILVFEDFSDSLDIRGLNKHLKLTTFFSLKDIVTSVTGAIIGGLIAYFLNNI